MKSGASTGAICEESPESKVQSPKSKVQSLKVFGRGVSRVLNFFSGFKTGDRVGVARVIVDITQLSIVPHGNGSKMLDILESLLYSVRDLEPVPNRRLNGRSTVTGTGEKKRRGHQHNNPRCC